MWNESLSDNWAPISKPEHSDPSEKTNFCALLLRSHSFDHYPERVTIEQSRDVDQPVYQHLCFYTHLSLHHNGGLQCPNRCSRCTNPSIPYFPLLSLWTSPGFLNSSTKTHLWPRSKQAMDTPCSRMPSPNPQNNCRICLNILERIENLSSSLRWGIQPHCSSSIWGSTNWCIPFSSNLA